METIEEIKPGDWIMDDRGRQGIVTGVVHHTTQEEHVMTFEQWERVIKAEPLRWKLEKYLEALKALRDWPEFTREYAWTGTGALEILISQELDTRASEREKKMEFVRWNTGRKYTEHGQRMAAVLVDGYYYFSDIDRNIDGRFACPYLDDEPTDTAYRLLQSTVMEAYDGGSYEEELFADRDIVKKLREVARG